jgi:hypothetical protein
MNINQLLVEQEIKKGYLLLESVTIDMTADQKRIVEGIYNEFVPLLEATLTTTQIKQMFGDIEKQSIAGGNNRTITGATVDVAKQANDTINKIGSWLQDTTPVKAFDAKFEQLKGKVAQKFPELADQASNLGDWVKANPGKSAAVIGVLTALASLAGGPVGGAIAGQVLKGATELLKGEKLSTAIGKGIKTAALGYLSGKAFEMLGNWVGGFREQAIPFGPKDAGLEKVNWGATQTLTAPGMSSTETIQGFNITVFPEQREAVTQAMNAIRDGQAGGFDTLKTIAREINTPEYKSSISSIMQGARQVQLSNDSLLQWINGVSKAGQVLSQGAIAASDLKSSKKESYYVQDRPLSEGQVYMVFNRVLTEADFMKKALGAVAKGANWVGKQTTEKVTSAKLLTAWRLEGSPTDSEELKKFLLNYGGIDQTVIDKVYTDMKIQGNPAQDAANPKAQTAYAQVKTSLSQLNTKQRKQLMLMLKKQLGTA